MLFEAGHLYDLACQPCLNSQPLSPLSKLSPLPPMSPMSPVSLSPLAQPPAFGTCLVRKEEDQESHILGIRMRGRQLSNITNKQTTKTKIQHSHPVLSSVFNFPRWLRHPQDQGDMCPGERLSETREWILCSHYLRFAQRPKPASPIQHTTAPFFARRLCGEKKRYSCGDFLIKIWFSRPPKQTITQLVQE